MGYTHTHLSLVHTHHFALCQRGTHILILGTAPRQWHLAGGFYMRHFQWLEWSQKKFMGETKDAWPHHHPSPPPSFALKGGPFVKTRGRPFEAHIHISQQTPLFFFQMPKWPWWVCMNCAAAHDFHTRWWGPVIFSILLTSWVGTVGTQASLVAFEFWPHPLKPPKMKALLFLIAF